MEQQNSISKIINKCWKTIQKWKKLFIKLNMWLTLSPLPRKKQYHNSGDPTKQGVSWNQILMYSYINKNITKIISAVQCKFVSLVESWFNYIYMYVLLWTQCSEREKSSLIGSAQMCICLILDRVENSSVFQEIFFN